MKAFMSERRHYDLCQCPINTGYYGLACECPQRALAEARRILAETEPVPPEGRVAATVLPVGPACVHFNPEPCAALADALRAFVECENP